MIAVAQHHIHTTIDFGAATAEGGERGILDVLRDGLAEVRGAMVERLAFAGHPGVFVVDVVKAVDGLDVDHGQHLIAQHADGELLPGDVIFDQSVAAELLRVLDGRVELALMMADMHADAGALARGLHDERKANLELRAAIQRIDLRARRGHAGGDEALLAQFLVEGDAARLHASAGVADAFRLEDGLDLPVLTEGAVDQIHRDEDITRHVEIRPGDIHLDHLRPERAEGLHHAFRGLE